jgi:Flp pilus assembly protein TadG
MIALLLVFLLFAVLQVAMYFYVRNIVAASASDGARYAASEGIAYSAGAARASSLVRQGLTAGIARDVSCAGSGGLAGASALPVAMVRCSGRIRSVFLPLGAFLSINVTSRALKEGAP